MANALWNSSRRPSHSLSVMSPDTSCARRTSHAQEPQQGVHAGYTENDARVIPFKSRRKNGGGGGSRTPVRKALRHEAYMLSSIPFGSPATLRMSKKRSRLVR